MKSYLKSHYDTLGIEKSADARQIKRAYFNLVKQFPPERFPEKFKEIRAAYDALSDEGEREKHDKTAALPEDAAFLYSEAQKARQYGRDEHVADIYSMILEKHPELKDIREEYARSLEVIGKTGKAIGVWEKLCASEPDNVRYAMALADCYEMRGWRKKAIGAYIRAIEIDDGDVNCWTSLIECHIDGSEHDDAARVAFKAVEVFKERGKESIYIYSCAAAFGAKGDPSIIEGFLQDIVRLVRTGEPDPTEIRANIPVLLNLIMLAELMRFYPYIREMVDALPYKEDSMRDSLLHAERFYEIDMLEEKGLSILFHDLFMALDKECDCDNCRMDIMAMECNILEDLDTFRPQLLLLKKEHPLLYAMHDAFFNEAIRVRDPERMLYQRLKKLSKHGFYPNFISDEDDEASVQQTVRREGPKIGRNDPCPCGSGKKYKKCCGG